MEAHRTLYFKNLHLLHTELLDSLLNFLQKSPSTKGNKLLFSCVQADLANGKSQNPIKKIQQVLPCTQLFLPSLRDYAEDIPNIVHMMINDLNIKLGTLVIGLQPQALQLLQDDPWAGDMEQLIAVMTQLVQGAGSNLILLDAVREALRAQLPAKQRYPHQLDLNQPLDDIISDIIKAVLEEEGHNQSKTAKRLGISRATLWRRLRPGSPQDGEGAF